MQKELTCCFSGHRIIEYGKVHEIKKRVQDVAEKLTKAGVTQFFAGGAIGFDMLCAEVIIELRKKYKNIKLILAIPYPGQQLRWSQAQQKKYAEILAKSDERYIVSSCYSPDCYHKRNRFMVDKSDVLICYLEKPSGGTYYTARYAQENDVHVINIAKK